MTSRRTFLKLGLGAVAAAALPLTISCRPVTLPQEETVSLAARASELLTAEFQAVKEIVSKPVEGLTTGELKTHLLVLLDLFRGHIVYASPKEGVDMPNPDPEDGDYTREWELGAPGPTLRVNPGDTIDIWLHNRLATLTEAQLLGCEPRYMEDLEDIHPNCFHITNVTNIHYHGLHVDQGPHADNVFVKLYPKDQPPAPGNHPLIPTTDPNALCPNAVGDYHYTFQIPWSHPQGTFWYHPHVHGSSAFQSANGLAGALIVNDELHNDAAFQYQPLEEKVMVFQLLARDHEFGDDWSDGAVVAVNGIPTAPFRLDSGPPQSPGTPMIPGVQIPEITIREGQIQRWRIVNASWSAQSNFEIQLPDPELVEIRLIAMDGNFLPQKRWEHQDIYASNFFLAPSNRMDLLVKGKKAGRSTLPAMPTATPAPQPGEGEPVVKERGALVTVNVEGHQEIEMNFPAHLPALPMPDLSPLTYDDVKAERHTLKIFNEPDGGNFLMGWDDKPPSEFDETLINKYVQTDRPEMWIIENHTLSAHPFHIHLNPFYIPRDDELPDELKPAIADPRGWYLGQWTHNDPRGLWQDSILIPPRRSQAQPGKVVIWQRFPRIFRPDGSEIARPYTYVYHCHILTHEDRGFMHVVQVKDDVSDVDYQMPGACIETAHH